MIPTPTSQPPPPPRRLRAIFFDAAGTLFRLREPVGRTYARIAARHGMRVEPGKLDAAFRETWRHLPPPLHPEGQPPGDDDRSWWREVVRRTFALAGNGGDAPEPGERLFGEIYDSYGQAAAWELHEETLEAVHELSSRFRLLVLSNFDRRLRGVLQGLGVARFFEEVVISSEVGSSKPDPRMFRAALAACELPPEDCLHVGDDRSADGAGAEAAGIAYFHIDRPGVTLLTLVEKLGSDDFPACIRCIPD